MTGEQNFSGTIKADTISRLYLPPEFGGEQSESEYFSIISPSGTFNINQALKPEELELGDYANGFSLTLNFVSIDGIATKMQEYQADFNKGARPYRHEELFKQLTTNPHVFYIQQLKQDLAINPLKAHGSNRSYNSTIVLHGSLAKPSMLSEAQLEVTVDQETMFRISDDIKNHKENARTFELESIDYHQ